MAGLRCGFILPQEAYFPESQAHGGPAAGGQTPLSAVEIAGVPHGHPFAACLAVRQATYVLAFSIASLSDVSRRCESSSCRSTCR